MEKKEALRMIPLTDEFMKNKKIYDRIWGFIQDNSYIGKDETGLEHRFIYASSLDNMKDLYNAINTQVPTRKKKGNEYIIEYKNLFCYNTFRNSFNLLFEPTEEELETLNEDNLPIGYLIKGKIKDNYNKVVDVFYIKEDMKPFKLIPQETLSYLMTVSNSNVIKIYSYLLNCFSYKSSTSNEKYRFTKEELTNAIGYSSKTYNWNIDFILESLESCGLISYHIEQVTISKTTKTYYYFLDNVSLHRTNKKIKPTVSNTDENGGFKW